MPYLACNIELVPHVAEDDPEGLSDGGGDPEVRVVALLAGADS